MCIFNPSVGRQRQSLLAAILSKSVRSWQVRNPVPRKRGWYLKNKSYPLAFTYMHIHMHAYLYTHAKDSRNLGMVMHGTVRRKDISHQPEPCQ